MRKIFFLLLLFLVCGCDSDKNAKQPGKEIFYPAAQDHTLGDNREKSQKQNVAINDVLPSSSEIERADKFLAYSNKGRQDIDEGYYSLADKFYVASKDYLKTWKLPTRPKVGSRVDLKPEAGLFDEAEARLLTKSLAGMDKALETILAHYMALEKYVADSGIRDDGKRGRQIVAQIDGAHADFIASRHTWLDIVEKRAAEAERIILREEPLQRQIDAGSRIFGQFREVVNILASGSSQPEMLTACKDNIDRLLAEGARPPFPGRPHLERLYRAFLKNVELYQKELKRGISEGFYGPQRRELNLASHACVNAWNEFAREASRH